MEPLQAAAGFFDVFGLFDVYGRPAITAIKTPKRLVGAEWTTLSQFRASVARLRVCYHVLSLLRPGIGRWLQCEFGEVQGGREGDWLGELN